MSNIDNNSPRCIKTRRERPNIRTMWRGGELCEEERNVTATTSKLWAFENPTPLSIGHQVYLILEAKQAHALPLIVNIVAQHAAPAKITMYSRNT